MSSPGRAALIVSVAAVLSARARADADTTDQTRATIRGSGKDVSIVYRGAKPKRLEPSARPDVLAEATRQAAAGADDASIIAYLRTHQGELPSIIAADAVRRLRRAGAGPPVVSELSRLSALDIGETAEGAPQVETAAQGAPNLSGYGATYPDASMGYPFYGFGYGFGSPGFGFRPHRGGRFFPHRPAMAFPRPASPMPPLLRGPVSHARMPRLHEP